MPELPDLQVFSRNLDKMLKGKRVHAVRIESKRITPALRQSLEQQLVSKKIKKVYREGKELRFAFDNKTILGIHLMLRGTLTWVSTKDPVKYALLVIEFDKGPALALTDPRNMAKVMLNPVLSTVPDALSAGFTPAYLGDILKKSRATIKSILTDQHLIRGIGNAYADEILWKARLAPQSIAQKIPLKNGKLLFRAIQSVLESATEQIYKEHPALIGGEIRDFLKIHQPGKEKSPTGAAILVQTTSGSKTYYTEEQQLYV